MTNPNATNENYTFEDWMKCVDDQIAEISTTNLGSADLADFLYRDKYNDGCTAREVAIEALENEDFPFEEQPI